MEIFAHPTYLLATLSARNLIYIPDKIYLRIKYKKILGKKLNLEEPKTFNEKLQWLKLHRNG